MSIICDADVSKLCTQRHVHTDLIISVIALKKPKRNQKEFLFRKYLTSAVK